jgi:hypothetical protein
VIKQCAEGSEGPRLLEKSFQHSNALGVGASPTWVANGKYEFSGVDAETIKTERCKHNAKLAGCNTTLSGAAKPSTTGQPKCDGIEPSRGSQCGK